MPRYKAKNAVTGEEVSFDWTSKKPPTEADVERISDEQRAQRIKTKQKIASISEPSFMDKLLMSKPTDYALKAADALGLNQPWEPVKGLHDVGAGMQQVIQGTGTEAHPRLAGAVRAAKGAMQTLGPVGEAAGIALAPEVTLPAVAAGNLTTKGVAAVEPDDWSPEVKEAVAMGAGLAVGGKVGHQMSKLKVSPPPTQVDPQTGALTRQPPQYEPPPRPRTGVNYSFVDRPDAALPAPNTPPPSTPPPSSPTVQPPLDMTPSPSAEPGVPEFNYGDRASVTGATPDQRLLPEKGEPIPDSVVKFGQQPIQMPAAGETPMNVAPTVRPPALAPKSLRQFSGGYKPMSTQGMAMPNAPTVEPPDVEMFRGGFEPPKDLVSQDRPTPVTQSEVSTVPVTPPVKPPDAAASVSPAAAPPAVPPTPPPAVPPSAPPVPPTPPAAAPPQAPPPGPVLPGSGVGTGGVTPSSPPATPPPALPQAPPPPAAPPPPPPVVKPPVVQPPAPPAPPTVQSPMDIARAAMAQAAPKPDTMAELARLQAENAKLKGVTVKPPAEAAPPATLPEVKAPGVVEPEPDTGLSPKEKQQAQLNNAVVDFLKKRRDVTIDQLQRNLGVPADTARSILDNLKKRGLVDTKRGKFNYVRARGEEIEPVKDEETPPAEPESKEVAVTNPKRQQRINDLQVQIGQAEDEGDTFSADVMRNHLRDEERNAKIEAKGSPEAKTALKSMDDAYSRIEELEAKEKEGLSPEEEQELVQMYKKANSLGEQLSNLWKDESGESQHDPRTGLPTSKNPVRNYFARRRYIEEHGIDMEPNAVETEFGRKNQVLRTSDNVDAAIIGTKVPQVEVKKLKFVGTFKRRGAEIHKGLSLAESKQVGEILNKFTDPEQARGYSPKVTEAAIKTRDLLDEIYGMFPQEATRRNESVGYLQGYLTHMRKLASGDSDIANALEDVMNYHLAPIKAFAKLFQREPMGTTPGETNLGVGGVGQPQSPFVEHRTADMQDFETDIRKILPAYIEGAGKVIYDKPLIAKMSQNLANIPEGRTADIAKSYLRHYARYDAFPGLDQDWNSFTGKLMRMHARAVLGLSTRLLGLHAGRLFAQVLPEIPAKYWAEGAKALANPIENYDDLGRRGVLPQNSSPWLYKKPMEKYEAMLRFFDAGDAMSDVVGWHALKAMYLDRGLPQTEAENMATDKLMDLSMRMTPARMANVFTRQMGFVRPVLQYKQQIMGIAEQYVRAAGDIVKQRQLGRFMRYLTGGLILYEIKKKLGLTVTHLNPVNLGQLSAGAYDVFNFTKRGTPAYKASHGDVKGALEDLGLYVSGAKNPLREFQRPTILGPVEQPE